MQATIRRVGAVPDEQTTRQRPLRRRRRASVVTKSLPILYDVSGRHKSPTDATRRDATAVGRCRRRRARLCPANCRRRDVLLRGINGDASDASSTAQQQQQQQA